MAKVNNPEGINQYTKSGGSSSKPYRYSIGGYFATQKVQKTLNKLSEEAIKSSNALMERKEWNQKVKEEFDRTDAITSATLNYSKVSRPETYLKNLKDQTANDAKQVAEKIRKRMWGG